MNTQQTPREAIEPCHGMNCGCTDSRSHSPECEAGHAAAIAGGQFVKGAVAVVRLPELPEPAAWVSFDVLSQKERLDRLPITSIQPSVYKHGKLFDENQMRDYATAALAAKDAEIAKLRELLAALLDEHDSNTCTHESTHRGGAIWTICDDCDKKWADDRGGFKPHKDSATVAKARAALTGSDHE